MPCRKTDLLLIFGLGVLVNLLAAACLNQPGYMDAYYYFNGAVQLARGQGFTEPYVWNYFDSLRTLPHPSHLYWMPLTSLVAAPGLALAEGLAGHSLPLPTLFKFAQIPFAFIAAALPLLSYLIAWLTTALRRHALAAALLTLFSVFYFSYWTTTDGYALYALTAAGALLCAALGAQRRSARWFFLAGLGAALAHLTRADGLAILFCLLLIALSSYRPLSAAALPLGAGLLGYLLLTTPWFIRNVMLVGSPLAPNGMRAIWLVDYNELFNLDPTTLTPAHYLAAGWRTLLAGKWAALQISLGTLVGPLSSIVALPGLGVGLWKLRRQVLYWPACVYALGLFGLMTFVFTFPGMRGGLFHSGATLLPFFFPAALVGLDAILEWVPRWRKQWKPARAKPVFSTALVIFAVGLTAYMFKQRVIGANWQRPAWNTGLETYTEIGAWFKAHYPEPVTVAVNDPPTFYYATGLSCLVIPNGPPADLLQALTLFNARWVVIDRNLPQPLYSLYTGPTGDPRFTLRATFTNPEGQPVYLFQIQPQPLNPGP